MCGKLHSLVIEYFKEDDLPFYYYKNELVSVDHFIFWWNFFGWEKEMNGREICFAFI